MPKTKGINRAEVVRIFAETGSKAETARVLGVDSKAISYHLKRAEVGETTDPERPISEILATKRQRAARTMDAHKDRTLVPIRIDDAGPIGIALFGDPHLDDPGCDFPLFESHLKMVRETDGMYAACVGDYINNWSRRLAHLHADQDITASEAWRLIDWMLDACEWLFLIGGNHDAWTRANDLLAEKCKTAGVLLEYHRARFEVLVGKGKHRCAPRLFCAHDFPGRSQYSNAFGAAKTGLWQYDDDLLVCGHIHAYGYQEQARVIGAREPDRRGNTIKALRLGSYKVVDDFAKARGFRDGGHHPCRVAIIDPYATEQEAIVTVHSPMAGADYLTWLRAKRK